TALSLKLDRCLNRVTSLENELGITKKVLGGAVLKLVTKVKWLEGLLQQRKQRLVLFDSEGEDATPTEQDIDLVALHTLASTSLGGDSSDKAAGHDAAEVLADTTMPFRITSTKRRRLKKPFTSFASAHVPENIPIGVGIPAAATTILAGSSMDAAVHAAAAHLSSIPVVDKGKAPMVDDSFPADLLSEQERILKNLHNSQLGKDLAKKLHAEQEAEFARQQEELAQKAQVERVASPTEHGPGLSDQCRRELDAAQLIYTEADWVEILAKIATNSALSKKLLVLGIKCTRHSHCQENFLQFTFHFHSQKEMDHQYPTVAKIPVLDTGKFEQWQFQIQQYLQHEHYALWEVIEFGDSYKVPTTNPNGTTTAGGDAGTKSGRTVTITTKDMQRKKNDVKARTTLLLSLPDEHQLRFSKMRADKFWKKTGKKIIIQGLYVVGFDKSKVECFNCHKMGHFARECRAPRSQERGRKDNYRQGSKAEEKTPKALMAIDGVGWDWSYMANEGEDHALVADEEAPTEFALMANTKSK
nr:hypothetical protein [Tanacetum cinerariifolium]